MFRTSHVYHQEDHLYMPFVAVCFSWLYVSSLAGGRTCSILYRAHACAAGTNGLPDDEHIMFETCRRHQELN
jgi:hypothetical protein